jgi:hypothetical protein
MEQPGFKMSTLDSPDTWGGMVVEYLECNQRFDFGPLFEGLPDSQCPCRHWGYVLKGALHMQYSDGNEEVIREGDACYMPRNHTGWCEADSAMIFFSPEDEAHELAELMAKKMQG